MKQYQAHKNLLQNQSGKGRPVEKTDKKKSKWLIKVGKGAHLHQPSGNGQWNPSSIDPVPVSRTENEQIGGCDAKHMEIGKTTLENWQRLVGWTFSHLGPRNSAPRYTPNGSVFLCSVWTVCQNLYHIRLGNGFKLETTQTSTHSRMDTWAYLFTLPGERCGAMRMDTAQLHGQR